MQNCQYIKSSKCIIIKSIIKIEPIDIIHPYSYVKNKKFAKSLQVKILKANNRIIVIQ